MNGEIHARQTRKNWLRQQLSGDSGISLNKKMLIFSLILITLMAGAAIIAAALGFGQAAILAALSVLFMLIAAFGGPLHSDLIVMAWFGPTFILVVGGINILTGVAVWLAIPLVVVIVFIAGLLPALSPRYMTLGVALALGALIGFGVQLSGTISFWSIFGGVAVGVIMIALVRVLLGIGDPDRPTRRAIAAVLNNPEVETIENAWRMVRGSRPQQWISDAMDGVDAYCGSLLILFGRIEQSSQEVALPLRSVLGEADAEAKALGSLIESKRALPQPVPASEGRKLSIEGIPEDLQIAVANLWDSLDRIRAAALQRDTTATSSPQFPGASFKDNLKAVFSWDSSILLHALRSAFVVLVAVLITTFYKNNPLNTTFLTTAYTIIQPTQMGTATKAVQRVAGAVIGVGIAGLLALILPAALLLPLALLALYFGLPFIRQNMVIFYAMLAVMTLLLDFSSKSLTVQQGLVAYVLYSLFAAAIALIFIFVVPRVEPNEKNRTVKAVQAVRNLLLTITSRADDSKIRDEYIRAARAVQNVLVTPEQQEKASEHRRNLTLQAGRSLEKMLVYISSLRFRTFDRASVATEFRTSQQLLDLDNSITMQYIMDEVKQPDQSDLALQQSSLMSNALSARQAASELLI